MFIIDNCLISEDLTDVSFVCNLKKCKGLCCFEGDAGAPVEENEIAVIENNLKRINLFLPDKNKAYIQRHGFFKKLPDEKFEIGLMDDKACVFAMLKDGIYACAIERADQQYHFGFQKPLSCHLYPVRISDHQDVVHVNVHHWNICDAAYINGRRKKTPLFRFLKTALIRKFGKAWFEDLEKFYEYKTKK